MPMHNPPHPGEFIWDTYLEPYDVSVRSFAKSIGVAASTVMRLVNGQSGVSPEMALRLSKSVGRSPESWLTMQHAYDLWRIRKSTDLSKVEQIQFGAA